MRLWADVPDPAFSEGDPVEVITSPHWLVGQQGVIEAAYWTNCNLCADNTNLFNPDDDKWSYIVVIAGQEPFVTTGTYLRKVAKPAPS